MGQDFAAAETRLGESALRILGNASIAIGSTSVDAIYVQPPDRSTVGAGVDSRTYSARCLTADLQAAGGVPARKASLVVTYQGAAIHHTVAAVTPLTGLGMTLFDLELAS